MPFQATTVCSVNHSGDAINSRDWSNASSQSIRVTSVWKSAPL